MFISICNLGKGKIAATKHHIKMSPQFEGWYNTLTPEEKKEVSLSVYAFFYGVLTGDINWQSESANINLGYNFTEIKQSPQFIRWYNKLKDPQTVELVRKRIETFFKDSTLKGKEHRNHGDGDKAFSLRAGIRDGLRIYASFFPLSRLNDTEGQSTNKNKNKNKSKNKKITQTQVPEQTEAEKKAIEEGNKTGWLCLLFGGEAGSPLKNDDNQKVNDFIKSAQYKPQTWTNFGIE